MATAAAAVADNLSERAVLVTKFTVCGVGRGRLRAFVAGFVAWQRRPASACHATMLAPVMLARNQQRADAKAGRAAHRGGSTGAGTPRWLSTLAASEWLRHSTEGYCATTEKAGAEACRTGDKGSSTLPHEVVERGWLAAATECVSRCAGCERCRFISVSLKQRDCRPADLRSYSAV